MLGADAYITILICLVGTWALVGGVAESAEGKSRVPEPRVLQGTEAYARDGVPLAWDQRRKMPLAAPSVHGLASPNTFA